ncbi:MAG: phosphate ABC transporter permease, partial [Gammaproteobacteria bacterium]|nr:phosphate ABC transporter permease [Gammaproteobacteria bacterium]
MLQRRYNQRALKDRLARYFVAIGGISVIAAILLIFFYLLQVVIPMFESADIAESQTYSVTDEGKILHIGIEEQGTMGVRFTENGLIVFFQTDTGKIVESHKLDLPSKITTVTSNNNHQVIIGLANGQVMVVKYVFELSYGEDERIITPLLEYPLGKDLLVLDESGQALEHIDLQYNQEGFGLVGTTSDKR